jgi:hypothetical protein
VSSVSTTSNPTEKDVVNATTSITVTNTDTDITDTDALMHILPKNREYDQNMDNDDMDQTNPNKIPAVLPSSITSAIATPSSSQFTKEQIQLLQRISTISRFCDVQDNELRPCHQLDYATSGILLIARSKSTASRARTAFEDRNVYTGILTAVTTLYFLESFIEKLLWSDS